MNGVVTIEDIYSARKVIKDSIKRTMTVECPTLSTTCEGGIFFKLENLQKTGSFKVRGALNKIANLSEEEKKNGVIASSAGNHAQGVALGATAEGITSTIVMPTTAPLAKIKATENLGGKVVLHGDVYDDAYSKACEIQGETGATFIHPFDDKYVIAGQGTIGLEILEDVEDVDTVIVPIGGGGIISGIASAIKYLKPHVKVIGVEAENAPSMMEALKNSCPIKIDSSPTIADGIAVRQVGELTCNIVKERVDEIVTVTEKEISKAILFLLEQSKVVAEGAGATAIAALLAGKIDTKGKNVVSVITGGNIDINVIERIVNRGLLLEGRKFKLVVKLKDKSGELERLLKILTNKKANILNVNQSLYREDLLIGEQEVDIILECFDRGHKKEIIQSVVESGYIVLK